MFKEGDIIRWTDFVKYKNEIKYMDCEVKELFDTLSELLPVIWEYDRLGTFLSWRRNAFDIGIINRKEFNILGDEMRDGCGGM
jgi:GTP-sensing pleiotropic transcriptional regulator CodY